MKWQDVRQQYPDQWLLLEAFNPITTEQAWLVDELSVIADYQDGSEAFKAYGRLQNEHPERNLFIFHTSRPKIEIGVRRSTGLRRSAW